MTPVDRPDTSREAVEDVIGILEREWDGLPREAVLLRALLAERAALQGEVATLRATIRIMDLSTPLEDELSDRIAEMLKYLAMGDGFTVSGVARLFVDCQRRMAVDWQEITRLRHYPVQSPPPVSPDGPHGAER
jgi:hypothetical protein